MEDYHKPNNEIKTETWYYSNLKRKVPDDEEIETANIIREKFKS